VRVAVFNYLDDPSGANTVHAVISIAGATMPSSVKVKYLAAASVVQKGGYTWAGQVRCVSSPSSLPFPPLLFFSLCTLLGTSELTSARLQTFGGFFESDGRPTGQEDVQTVQCDTTAQTCTVDVPAPGFALVFLTDDAFTESKGAASVTFPTTAQTKTRNTGAF
jgi:hypothetical protein